MCDMLQIYSDLDESYQKRKINEYAIALAVLGVICGISMALQVSHLVMLIINQ